MNQWINRGHPETLLNATILCYIKAAFGLFFGVLAASYFAEMFIIVGLAAGGYGIANDKKWGFWLAVAAASVAVVSYFIVFRLDWLSDVNLIISFAFAAALLALLLHPRSREYQKVWFR